MIFYPYKTLIIKGAGHFSYGCFLSYKFEPNKGVINSRVQGRAELPAGVDDEGRGGGGRLVQQGGALQGRDLCYFTVDMYLIVSLMRRHNYFVAFSQNFRRFSELIFIRNMWFSLKIQKKC